MTFLIQFEFFRRLFGGAYLRSLQPSPSWRSWERVERLADGMYRTIGPAAFTFTECIGFAEEVQVYK